jgi:beta-glucosidase
MASSSYQQSLPSLLDKGLVKLQDLETCVANVLRVKYRLDLFKNYYTDPARASILLDKKHLEAAKNIALQSAVLLQNTNKTLPISKTVKSIAVIGPLADDGFNHLGCWAPDGQGSDTITPLKYLQTTYPTIKLNIAKGFTDCRAQFTDLFAEAIAAAKASDVVLMFMGEDNNMSGEGNSRANIGLPGLQEQLIQLISLEKKPTVLVLNAGRSLILTHILPLVQSILYTWQLGTMAGPAIIDLLFGVSVPSGKSPITFPRERGQIPLYYNKKNTGRPNNTHEYKPFTSSYIDIDSTPLFTFGFGLSYTTFTYSVFKLSKKSITYGETISASVVLKNEGTYIADEVTMLFVRDLVGSYTRPVKELKGFKRTSLKPGEFTTLTFVLSTDDLCFWTKKQEWKAEPGKFQVWIGGSANATLTGEFDVTAAATNAEEEFEELMMQ